MNKCSYSASKCGVFEGYLQFYQVKQKIVFIFFKTNPNVFVASKIVSGGVWHYNQQNQSREYGLNEKK